MKTNIILITGALFLFSFSFYPNFSTSSDSNFSKKNEASFYYVLDNRYEGGSDAFIDLFEKNVWYSQEAFDNCRVGISKIKLTISKDGELEKYEFLTDLGMGLEENLSKFFDKTKENWKAWARSSEMEMTVGFSLITQKNSYYPDADLIVLEKSAYKMSTKNTFCDPDDKIIKRVKKFMKKKKYSKAEAYVDEMIRRYPDNEEYAKYKETVEKKLKK